MKIILEFCGKYRDQNRLNELAKLAIFADCFSTFYLKKIYTSYTISILMCDEVKIQELNLQFREKNSATNVLSFPSLDVHDSAIHLGDIAICMNIITNEAKDLGEKINDYFDLMFTHSILHLIGYDHIEDEDRILMESLEDAILTITHSAKARIKLRKKCLKF